MIRRLSKTIILLLALIPSLQARDLHIREVALPEAVRTTVLDLLFVDRDGYLWLAAGPDIYWYDGLSFNQVKTDTTGRFGDAISTFYHDRNNQMWLGWESGYISIIQGDSTLAYHPEEGTPSAPIVAFAEDSLGQLWMATDGEGLYVRNPEGRWYNFNGDDGLPSEDSYALVPHRKGVVLATDQGLVEAFFINEEKTISTFSKSEGLSDQIVKALYKDEEGLWLGYYESSIDQLNDSLKIIQSTKAPGFDTHMLMRTGKTSWWLSEAGHLYNSFAGGRWQQVILDASQRIRVRHLAQDHEGHMWVATDKGLFMVDLWYEQYSAPEAVTAIAAAGDTMWYSRGGDLYYIDINTGESQAVWQGDNPVLNIYVDDFGRVWSGTFDEGLKIWDSRVKNLIRLKEVNGLVNNNVLSIDGNKEGIWVGTLGGVSHFSLDENGNYDKPESHEQAGGERLQYIYSVHVSDAGEVYLATDGDGVMRWGGLLFEPLSEQVVLDVTTDQQGKVWWITPEGELFWWTQSEGSNQVPAIKEETGRLAGLKVAPNGDILLFHEKGIHRWKPAQKQWIHYGRSFGLGRLQPELHAQAMGPHQLLCLGTARGVSCLKMDLLPVNPQPSTHLTGTDLYLESTSKREFSYRENHISFHYIGRWYTDPDRVRYKVKLEGYDLDWNISQNTSVTYPRLSPGVYQFSVVAGIDGQYPESEIKSISFSIAPPWYSRWYVIVLFVLVAGGLVYLFVQNRMKRLRYEQQREKERVMAQYEAIKSQVNPHFLFNSFNTLMAMIEDNKEEAQAYLSDLSDFFRHILQFREIDLISLEEELEVVKTYLGLQEMRFGAALQVEIAVDPGFLSSKIPPLTLQLLVENAFKHNVVSRSKPLKLSIYTENDQLVVWNRLQEKSQKAASTGYGLDSIKKKYQFYSGKKVRVNYTENEFAVLLPIIKNSSL